MPMCAESWKVSIQELLRGHLAQVWPLTVDRGNRL